jgi:hypothetical protein
MADTNSLPLTWSQRVVSTVLPSDRCKPAEGTSACGLPHSHFTVKHTCSPTPQIPWLPLLQHSGEDVLLRVVSASVVPPSVADAPDAPL